MHYNQNATEFKYLIVSERDCNFGLSVNTVGFQSIEAGGIYPPKNHPDSYYFSPQQGRVLNEYQLVYITKGKGTFHSETTPESEIEKGTLLILFPGQWHSYSPNMETGWNEYYIGFKGTIADNLFSNSFISKENQVVSLGINEDIVSLFSKALEVAESDKSFSQQCISGIILHIIGEIIYISNNQKYEMNKAAQKIECSKIIMRENIEKEIDAKEIATKLNISYSWFRKVFKEYTGYAPAKYFQELKIRKAKQLLVETSLPIKEICYKLNYSSTEHFFSVFKKSTMMTPSEYRNIGKCPKKLDEE